MKITIERKSFIDALSVGGQMSGKSRGLSILDNIKLTIKNLTATISSYDGEVAIIKRVNIVENDEEFIVCVDPKTLGSILNSIKDDVVELYFSDNKCEIKHSKGFLSMPFFDADEYPSPIIDKKTDSFELKSELLFNWFKEARNFVSTNTLYPQLMGVCIYIEDGEFGIASSDMSVLYHDKIEYDYHGEKQSMVISLKALNAILPMINGSEKVYLINSERNIIFRTSDSMLIATKSEAPFPNFKAIIPSSTEIEISVGKNEFLESIKRTMITADEKTCLIKLEVSKNSIKIHSENTLEGKSSHDECVCECSDENISIAARGNYMINMINSIESESMKILLSHPTRPILWCDMLNNNKVLLQMPCAM